VNKVIEKYQNAIIQIATQSATGTGFYVKEFDLIVTNEHVIDDNPEVTIAGKIFQKTISRVWYTDRKHDLAFWKARRKLFFPR
jgi:serine protease Do